MLGAAQRRTLAIRREGASWLRAGFVTATGNATRALAATRHVRAATAQEATVQCATGLEKLSIAVVMARVDVGPAMALVTLHSAPLGHQRRFSPRTVKADNWQTTRWLIQSAKWDRTGGEGLFGRRCRSCVPLCEAQGASSFQIPIPQVKDRELSPVAQA